MIMVVAINKARGPLHQHNHANKWSHVTENRSDFSAALPMIMGVPLGTPTWIQVIGKHHPNVARAVLINHPNNISLLGALQSAQKQPSENAIRLAEVHKPLANKDSPNSGYTTGRASKATVVGKIQGSIMANGRGSLHQRVVLQEWN